MHDNDIGMGPIIAPLLVLLFSILLGISGYFLTGSWQGLYLLILLGSAVPIAIFYQIRIRNPRMIDIQEDGFVAVFWNGRSKFIPWERMYSAFHYPGDPTKFGMAKHSGGGYSLKAGGLPYSLKGELGKEMREAYARKMGKYPPMR